MMLKKYIPDEKIEVVTDDGEGDAGSGGDLAEENAKSSFVILEDSGIDTTKGLTNCGGDPDFYRSILFEYYSSAEEKKEDLRKFLEAGNLENYGILIHSLKSTSAMIGANAPYRIALELEAAAQRNDREFVLSNHESFLKKYQTVLDALEKVVSENDEMKDFVVEEDGIMEFLPE